MIFNDIFIVGTARTAIGTFGGALRDVPNTQLATTAVAAAIKRSQVPSSAVQHVVMGNVIPTEPRDAYLSRVAAIDSGCGTETVAYNVNRLCGSGLQAIENAATAIQSGDSGVAVGGGSESMSRGPFLVPSARFGQRMGDTTLVDYMLGILHDPWEKIHMGITAENIARRYGVSREDQDVLALLSQQRAHAAITEGRFRDQIVPIVLKSRKGEQVFDTDEHVKPATTLDALSKMRPAFKSDGTVTAGNASGINDGAAAVVLASATAVRDHGLKPLARIVSTGHSGVDPLLMGIGPVEATRRALKQAGLGVGDLDVIESNEAFAAQALAVMRELQFDPAKVNPNGSGISLGHPVGATGAILVTKAVAELHRIQGRYALCTMCIGGGQGIALVLERV